MLTLDSNPQGLAALCDHQCQLCDLHSGAKTVCVAGRGVEPPDIKLLLVGEAPGKSEDHEGLPFVGSAGELLDTLLEEAGVDTSLVRWENVVRCFSKSPTGSPVPPSKKQVAACLPYLYRILSEVALRQEQLPLVVALGNTALEALTGLGAITRNHGIKFPLTVRPKHFEQYQHLGRYEVLGTIHPSAILRSRDGGDRAKVVQDLRVAWADVTGQRESYSTEYTWIDSLETLNLWVDAAITAHREGRADWVAMDLETTGLDMYDPAGRIVAIALCVEPKKAVVVPFFHHEGPWRNDSLGERAAFDAISRLVTNVPVVGWNFKFDLKWCRVRGGFDVPNIVFDGLLARHWRYGTLYRNDLNTVAATELGFLGHGREMEAELRALRSSKETSGYAHMGYAKRETLLKYAGGDADATLQLCYRLRDELRNCGLYDHYMAMMVAGIRPMAQMEINGVAVNPQMTQYLSREYPRQIEPHRLEVEQSPWGQAAAVRLSMREKPAVFSISSGLSLRELLFEQMGFIPTKLSEKTQLPSADDAVLKTLIEFCESQAPQLDRQLHVIQSIRLHRKLSKLYSTYVREMPEHTRSDGFFHTTYNLSGTVTGRHSSSDPSLHTIPKGSDVRYQFVSRWRGKGGVIMAADMSQAEMRVAASLARDENMIETIMGGTDLHIANASKIFKIPPSMVTDLQRNIAKTAGFGVLYGISALRLSRTTGISLEEAETVIADFFSAFPGLQIWMDSTWATAQEYGLITTPFGRLRWLPDARLSPRDKGAFKKLERAKRQAINFPIQSIASDLTYRALLRVISELERLGLESKPFGFIHDSILIDTAPGEWWQVVSVLQDCMVAWTNDRTALEWLLVPMIAEFEICPGWGFPNKLSWTDHNTMTATGLDLNIQRLLGEITALGGNVLAEEEIEVKKKKGRRLTFSPGVMSGSPDAAAGKAQALF